MLFLCTLLHLAVDGVCGAALAAYAVQEPHFGNIVFHFHLYSLIAFGGQWLTGWVLDRKMNWILPGLAPIPILLGLGFSILAQAVLLGVGNCVFHVAAGIMILRRYPNYTEPGVFVSSGAIGLGLGINRICGGAFFLCLCAAAMLSLIFCELRKGPSLGIEGTEAAGASEKEAETSSAALSWASAGAGMLLLLCVTLRGFGGAGGVSYHAMLLPCVFAAGKALGGVCCDAIGYRRTIAFIFILSFVALELPFLPLRGVGDWLSPLLLALAFNMTMPLTLRLLHWCCPAWPGLMFGLAAGCLLPGAFWRGSLTVLPQIMIVVQFLSLFLAGIAIRRAGV